MSAISFVRRYPPSADTNLARVAGTLAERAVSELGLAIFGSEGLEYGNFAESHFRMAMTAGVAVGTTEINLNLVAITENGLGYQAAAGRNLTTPLPTRVGVGILDRGTGETRFFVEGLDETVAVMSVGPDGGLYIGNSPERWPR